MPSTAVIQQLAATAAKRLGGNLRLLALYGSGADRPQEAHDLDFLLVVDAVENCVTHATRDCRDIFPESNSLFYRPTNTPPYLVFTGSSSPLHVS
jgi:hypothetical protein